LRQAVAFMFMERFPFDTFSPELSVDMGREKRKGGDYRSLVDLAVLLISMPL